MSGLSEHHKQRISDLISNHQEGFSLTRDFYQDLVIYQAEMNNIWRRGWLFAGHSCQISQPGDYITYEVDGDSVIVLRDDNGEVKSFHNICRHRGTLLCRQDLGHIGRLVCPYHQWTYGRDGSLISCRGMHEDIDRNKLSLHSVQTREMAGLIFISLAEEPEDFDQAESLMQPVVTPQGLDRAKVAKIVDYELAANWKLVWENNRECYHCNVNHPQYIKANFDHYNADDTTEEIQEKISNAVQNSREQWTDEGLAVTHHSSGMTVFPDPKLNIWYSANRTVLVEGYVTESMDGRRVAPLMGNYTQENVGTLRMRTVPNFWNHSSCDHSVSTRLTPIGLTRTQARVIWLVDENAVEGEDYNLDRLMPFWQLTSEQDWEICETQQRGVNSQAYTPGPLSRYKEYDVDGFLKWYLRQLSTAVV